MFASDAIMSACSYSSVCRITDYCPIDLQDGGRGDADMQPLSVSSLEHCSLYLMSVWICHWDAASFSVNTKHSTLFPPTHTRVQLSAILKLRLPDWRHFVCGFEWQPVFGLHAVHKHTITVCLWINSCIYKGCDFMFLNVWKNPDRHKRHRGRWNTPTGAKKSLFCFSWWNTIFFH